MSSLETIKEHGYWEVVIRPARFVERRVEKLTKLEQFVQTNQVRVRGWPFPATNEVGRASIFESYVGASVEWGNHREAWRLYQSGMFVWLQGNRWDWLHADAELSDQNRRTKPGTTLSAGDALYLLWEVFEFAARLSLSDTGDDPMHVEIKCHRLAGRRLWIDPWHDVRGRRCEAQEWMFSRDLSRQQLAADARKIGFEAGLDLFQRFGWDSTLETLEGILKP